MKWSGRNVIAVLGFAMLGAVVAVGFAVGFLFVFPNISIGGITAVDERNSQTIYKGVEITEILTGRNLIIESETVQISFLMRKEAQAGEGTIVVEENATGISFNSVKRTHIEWTMTSIGGEKYYKIKVLEPKGMVKRASPTIVYINLWRDSRVPAGTSTEPYNIILRCGRSPVRFDGDLVDAENPEMMHIRKLTVDSAATVSIPVTPLNPMGEFTVDIESVTVNGNGVQMDSRCLIKGGVEIKGHIGKFSFASIGGSLNIVGDNNSVSVENDITGNVGWNAVNGSLLIRGKCANLNVTTTNAVIDINSVIGVNGAEMQTVSGNLHINEITGGGLQFTATGLASVSVGRVNGAVRIPEMGLGTVDLSNVRGNVDITSVKTNAGGITVSFDNTITANPTVKILGYDGDISVSNIRGDTDIAVRDFQNGTANANIYTHFLRVSLNVIITANMGYVAGHTDRANITVDLDTPIWGILDIIGTAYAENQNAAQIYIRNTVDSISTFWLQDWSVIESSPVSDDAFWTIVENAVGHSVLHSHIRVQTATKFFLK